MDHHAGEHVDLARRGTMLLQHRQKQKGDACVVQVQEKREHARNHHPGGSPLLDRGFEIFYVCHTHSAPVQVCESRPPRPPGDEMASALQWQLDRYGVKASVQGRSPPHYEAEMAVVLRFVDRPFRSRSGSGMIFAPAQLRYRSYGGLVSDGRLRPADKQSECTMACESWAC